MDWAGRTWCDPGSEYNVCRTGSHLAGIDAWAPTNGSSAAVGTMMQLRRVARPGKAGIRSDGEGEENGKRHDKIAPGPGRDSFSRGIFRAPRPD